MPLCRHAIASATYAAIAINAAKSCGHPSSMPPTMRPTMPPPCINAAKTCRHRQQCRQRHSRADNAAIANNATNYAAKPVVAIGIFARREHGTHSTRGYANTGSHANHTAVKNPQCVL